MKCLNFDEINANDFSSSVVTLGNFDGLHLGHRELIQKNIEQAKKDKLSSVIIVFWPHPREVLAPHLPFSRIYSKEAMVEIFKEMDPDYLVLENFTQSLAQLSPEDYLNRLLNSLKPKKFVVGYDFKIGANREGDINFLEKQCKPLGIEIIQQQPLEKNGQTVSSSLIRDFISEGNIEKANVLLKKPFYLEGPVVKGKQIGRTIGFATANLVKPKYIMPKLGVYITKTFCEEKEWPSVTNVGNRPTLYESTPVVIETHLITSQEVNIYDKIIKVSFLERIRDEKKFSSKDELKAQIAKDVQQAKEYFGNL